MFKAKELDNLITPKRVYSSYDLDFNKIKNFSNCQSNLHYDSVDGRRLQNYVLVSFVLGLITNRFNNEVAAKRL